MAKMLLVIGSMFTTSFEADDDSLDSEEFIDGMISTVGITHALSMAFWFVGSCGFQRSDSTSTKSTRIQSTITMRINRN